MDLYTIRQQLNMGIPLTKMKLRVTDYSRVSTAHEEQRKSLKNQIEHFDDMIKKNPNWTYVKGYVDEGITGTSDRKRENFMKMIEDGKAGKFDLIITKEISRFSRNTLDSIKYTRELLTHGVAVLFVNDNINTALPDAELRLTIMASMAQDEIRRLSERVKFGMNAAINRGNILGNNMLYGYKKDKLTGNLTIIVEEAKIVRKMYSMYAIDEMSISKIAKTFNDEGIKTGQNKNWCTSTIRRMLKNPKYKGYYCGKKTEIIDYMTKKVKILPENNWVIYEDKLKIPPIVDENIWERANIRLEARNKQFGKAYKDKTIYRSRYPFSAKMYCSDHKEVFNRRKQSKSSDEVTWTCARYLKKGIKECASPNVRESELYSIFDDIIKEFSIKLYNVLTILLEIYKDNKNNTGYEEEINKYNIEKEKIQMKKDKLLELSIGGDISNEEFKEQNDRYNLEFKLVEEKISAAEKNKKKFKRSEKNTTKFEKIIKEKINSMTLKEKLIDLLLDKIVISKINNDRNNVELNIFLNLSQKYIKEELKQSLIPTENGFESIVRKEYMFKRGYDTASTKRYKIKYKVNTFISL